MGAKREHIKNMEEKAEKIVALLPTQKAEALLVLGLVMQKIGTEVVQLVTG